MQSDANGSDSILKTTDHQMPKVYKSGVSRRDFISFCGAIAATLGLGPQGVYEVEAALSAGIRPPVLWLHFAECTGCTESLLRSTSPYFDDLILNTISLEYHETLMTEAGKGAEVLRSQVLEKYANEFYCVVEGSIPTADNGQYGTIGSRTMLAIAEEVLPKAKAIITLGSCASDGGLPAAEPNPAKCMGVKALFPNLKVPIIACPGCPPHPVNFIAILANDLLKGTLPSLDSAGRPLFAYKKTVHQLCGNLGTNLCLQSQGCRGIMTFNNCPQLKFNNGTSYCMQGGHVCIGCAEANFWDKSPYWAQPFWKSYTVKTDANQLGIIYRGNPEGIISNFRPVDAGIDHPSGNADAGMPADATTGTPPMSNVGGATSSGGSPNTGGSSSTGVSQATGGSIESTAPNGGNSAATQGRSLGCNLGGGLGAKVSSPFVPIVSALAAVAVKIIRSQSTVVASKGKPCPESLSTPSPESKDT